MALTKVKSGVRTLGTGEVATANIAVDPTNASNLSSGSVPLAQLGNAPEFNDDLLQNNISFLAFKIASGDSLTKFNMVDQVIDDFADSTGIDTANSVNENIENGYVSGGTTMTNLVYLSHFDEASDEATTWTPTVGPNGTAVNNVKIDNGSAKFGSLSLRYQSTANQGAYVIDSADFDFADSNFTVDFWVNFNGILPTAGQCQVISNAQNWQIRFQSGGTWSRLSFLSWEADNTEHDVNFNVDPRSGLLDSTGWHHFAWVRSGSSMYMFKDGTLKDTSTMNWTIRDTDTSGGGANLYLLSDQYGDWDTNFDGYIDEIRILNGTAAYTSSFTPETSAYEASTIEDLTLISTSTTAQATATTGDLVVLIENAEGTATLGTDIKGYISRNGNANYSTAVTWVDEGSWGTNKKILTARGIDLSSLAGTTDMRYKITTHNQVAGSKETRIHAVSLGWS